MLFIYRGSKHKDERAVIRAGIALFVAILLWSSDDNTKTRHLRGVSGVGRNPVFC